MKKIRLLQFFTFLLPVLSLYSYKTLEERKEYVKNLVQQMLQKGNSLDDISDRLYELRENTKESKDLKRLEKLNNMHKEWINDNNHRIGRKLAIQLKKETDDYRAGIWYQSKRCEDTPEYVAKAKINEIFSLDEKLKKEREKRIRYQFIDETVGGPNLLEDVEKNIKDLLQQKEAIFQEWPFA
jgi:hypothetical protein